MEFHYQGNYQPEDFKKTQQVLAGRSQKALFAFMGIVLVSIAIPLLVGARPVTFWTVAPAVVLAGFYSFFVYMNLTAPRRIYRQSHLLKGAIQGKLRRGRTCF